MNLPGLGLLAVLVLFFAYLFGQARIDEARADALLDTDDEPVRVDDWHGPDCDGCRVVAEQRAIARANVRRELARRGLLSAFTPSERDRLRMLAAADARAVQR